MTEQVGHACPFNPSLLGYTFEHPPKVRWINRCAGLAGEDEPMVLPSGTDGHPIGCLAVTVCSKGFDCYMSPGGKATVRSPARLRFTVSR